MKKHTFDGSDPIKIFDFLTRFVNEANIFAMSEAEKDEQFISIGTILSTLFLCANLRLQNLCSFIFET